jgi:hypothetical protein
MALVGNLQKFMTSLESIAMGFKMKKYVAEIKEDKRFEKLLSTVF